MKPIDCGDLYRDGRHYDGQTAGYVRDIPFFLGQVREYGDPVLELACGTGRITIPIAGAGFRVVGLDASPAMLAQGRKKAEASGATVEWVLADCRDFTMPKRFAYIFIPFNSITHLHDLKSLQACLGCVREHLHEHGRFVIDVFNPRLDILMRDPAQRYPVAAYPDPDGLGTVTITESNVYDRATQVNRIKWHYQIGEAREEKVVENNMRILFPQELDALLHYNGFEVEAKFGDFDGSPFDSASDLQIVVCRKMP